jgi:hypothetical protein
MRNLCKKTEYRVIEKFCQRMYFSAKVPIFGFTVPARLANCPYSLGFNMISAQSLVKLKIDFKSF